MPEDIFDIFSGTLGQAPLWLETVRGLSNAQEKMKQIASRTPGSYFIFCFSTQSLISQTNTCEKSRSASR